MTKNALVLSTLFVWLGLLAAAPGAQNRPGPAATKDAAPGGKVSLVPGKMPVFDLDYFVGRWDAEWIIPESTLGPGGTVKASETFKQSADPQFYVSDLRGYGPLGEFKGTSIMAHATSTWVVGRYDQDTTGVVSLKTGRIGAEEGHYVINYEGSPFPHKDHTVALRSKLVLMSPSAYRQTTQISVDGGPFVYLGSAWWYKDMNEPPRRPRR